MLRHLDILYALQYNFIFDKPPCSLDNNAGEELLTTDQCQETGTSDLEAETQHNADLRKIDPDQSSATVNREEIT